MIDLTKINEFSLIFKYLEGIGKRVLDVKYFTDFYNIDAAAAFDLGTTQGYVPNHQFFFGNISISAFMGGVIDLADQNVISTAFETVFFAHPPVQNLRVRLGVNVGMTLTGDGKYIGEKRLYGVGCNRMSVGFLDTGAAVIEYWVSFNGYMFSVI
jgi:hypothetical protein